MTDLVVAGAGMAGLVAAAEARRLGAVPAVFEKLRRPGGSMLLSSGVIWRHRDFDRFRAECPGGDPALQRLLFERLDADLRWLRSLGAPVLAEETGNPLTTGVRFDPAGLTAALSPRRTRPAARASQCGSRPSVRRSSSPPAASRPTASWCESTSRPRPGTCCCAPPRARRATACGSAWRPGACTGAGLDEVYARAMPAPPARVEPGDFVRLSQLYAAFAEVTERARRAS